MTERDLGTGQSLLRSIETDNLGNLIGGLGEVAIDSALNEGLLRDIPIIGVVTGLAKAQRDIRNELFLKKITIFLKQISNASPEERQRFAESFENDAESRRFGESVLILMERADSMEKPRIVGRIMCAVVRGQIDLSKAMRLAAMVDKCYLEDLDHLRKFESGPQFPEFKIVAEALQSAGFLSTAGIDGGTFGTKGPTKSGTIYTLNEYGKMLIEYGLQSNT